MPRHDEPHGTESESHAAAPRFVGIRAGREDVDDFEKDAQIAAHQYALDQELEQRRHAIRVENKDRKKNGLPPLPLPRSSKSSKKRLVLLEEDPVPSRLGGLESENQRVQRPSGSRASEGDETLEYEGQIILDFNPLERLAGSSSSLGLSTSEDLMKGTNQDGPPHHNTSTSDVKEGGQGGIPIADDGLGDLDQEEEPEGQYDDWNDPVVVPWQAGPSQRDEALSDQEGHYSDDELFSAPPRTATSSRSASVKESHLSDSATEPQNQIRPSFPFSAEQSQIGEYRLDATDARIVIPRSINRFLREYQRIGVQFLYDKYKAGRGAILGDDMGLGKTIQVISFLSAIMRKTGTLVDFQRRKKLIRTSSTSVNPRHWPTAIIVCPKSLISNWQRELETWGYFEYEVWRSDDAATLRAQFFNGYLDLMIVSFEGARTHIEMIKDLPLSVVIVDEAHRLKEPKAQSTLALKKIRCSSCFALTGTLVQNRIDEMWAVLDFVWRGWAGTLKQWREYVVNPIKKGHRREGTAEEVVIGIMRLGLMNQKVLPNFYLRRDKRLIADELPQKRDLVVFCPLGIRQISAYQALIDSEDIQYILRRNEPCECGSDATRLRCCHQLSPNGEELKVAVLRNISALTKVANHLALIYQAPEDTAQTRKVNRRIFSICMREDYDNKSQTIIEAALDPSNCGKWTLLASLLKGWRAEPNDNKVLLFSSSVRLLDMISDFIQSSMFGLDYDKLTGDVDARERQDMVDRFQDPNQDYFILLVSTLAGGVGLNLTAANKVVIFDPSWNPANDLQAMDRAFRIGQKRPVDVYRLIGKGTLEELKYERQIHKQQKARQLNDATFERRIHQGFEGGKTVEDQGELFGSQNIFRFDPNGFVSKNLEKVQEAEDRFLQDLLEAEDISDDGDEPTSEGEARQNMRKANLGRDRLKAQERRAQSRNDDFVSDVLGEAASNSRKEDNMLRDLHIASHVHDQTFKDSPEERKIFELGLQLMRRNPEIAKTMKANDLGKMAKLAVKRERKESRRSSQSKAKREGGSSPEEEDSDEAEPWAKRIQTGRKRHAERKLAELSD